MKHTLQIALVACAMFASTANTHAAPKTVKSRATQVRDLCRNKDTRIMMIHELMNTKEGRQEMARMLEHDDEFRSYYEANTVNPG